MSLSELARIGTILKQALATPTVNDLGRVTGQARRLRTVTPHQLYLAVVSALAARRVETLADLLRVFNHQQGVGVAYKAFYNRLARPGFEAFMRAMCGRLMRDCRLQTLEPDGEQAVAQFRDIVIQDGSSSAVKRALQDVFPGRFSTKGPAAVELHATYSGYADDVTAIHLAPDCEAERQFLPEPSSLTGCLFLADRGYPSLAHFLALLAHGGAFIIRLSTSHDPYVTALWQQGRRLPLAPPIRLSRFLAQHAGLSVDLDIEYRHADRAGRFRVVVAPARAGQTSRWCTNLSRTTFSTALVGRLCRFRWQIGVSSQGHVIQSVEDRPRPTDSGLVAWEAPWRESRTAEPSDTMLRKEYAQRTRLQRTVNAAVASLRASRDVAFSLVGTGGHCSQLPAIGAGVP